MCPSKKEDIWSPWPRHTVACAPVWMCPSVSTISSLCIPWVSKGHLRSRTSAIWVNLSWENKTQTGIPAQSLLSPKRDLSAAPTPWTTLHLVISLKGGCAIHENNLDLPHVHRRTSRIQIPGGTLNQMPVVLPAPKRISKETTLARVSELFSGDSGTPREVLLQAAEPSSPFPPPPPVLAPGVLPLTPLPQRRGSESASETVQMAKPDRSREQPGNFNRGSSPRVLPLWKGRGRAELPSLDRGAVVQIGGGGGCLGSPEREREREQLAQARRVTSWVRPLGPQPSPELRFLLPYISRQAEGWLGGGEEFGFPLHLLWGCSSPGPCLSLLRRTRAMGPFLAGSSFPDPNPSQGRCGSIREGGWHCNFSPACSPIRWANSLPSNDFLSFPLFPTQRTWKESSLEVFISKISFPSLGDAAFLASPKSARQGGSTATRCKADGSEPRAYFRAGVRSFAWYNRRPHSEIRWRHLSDGSSLLGRSGVY